MPPSQDPSKEKLWSESWKRIDRFLPELKKELALDAEQEQQAPASETPAPALAPTEPLAPQTSEAEKVAEKAEEKAA